MAGGFKRLQTGAGEPVVHLISIGKPGAFLYFRVPRGSEIPRGFLACFCYGARTTHGAPGTHFVARHQHKTIVTNAAGRRRGGSALTTTRRTREPRHHVRKLHDAWPTGAAGVSFRTPRQRRAFWPQPRGRWVGLGGRGLPRPYLLDLRQNVGRSYFPDLQSPTGGKAGVGNCIFERNPVCPFGPAERASVSPSVPGGTVEIAAVGQPGISIRLADGG